MADNATQNPPSGDQTQQPARNVQPWMKVLDSPPPKPEEGAPPKVPSSTPPAPTPAPPTTPAPPSTPPAAAPVQMDEKALEALVSRVATAAAPPKQYTKEEIDEIFHVYKVSDAALKELGLEPTPERVALMNTMLQGVAKQATTVASYQLQWALKQMQDQFAQQINPLMAFASQQRLEGMKVRFFDKFPDLKGLEPLIVKIKDSFVATGRKFETEDEAFKAVAEEAKALLSSLPGRSDGAGAQPGQPGAASGQPTPPRMPSTMSGGQGGAGAGKGASNKPKWQSVFD